VPILSLEQYSKEQLKEMSLIEIAYEYLKNHKQAVAFNQLINDIATSLELSEEEVKSRIAQFYTDMNIDGRFLALGENRWGLRVWYPVDTVEEEVVTAVKAKKKKAKKVIEEEDVDLDDYDDSDEDLDYDDEFVEDDDLSDDDDEFDEVDEFEDDEVIEEDDDDYDLEEDDLEEELLDDDDNELEDDEEEDL
jgi:DNA-directed RNA polymerase subunit delta